MSVRAAVFASGGGSNLQSLLDHEVPDGPYRVELVISDREDAGALERGRAHGREVVVIPVRDRSKEEVEAETLEALSTEGAIDGLDQPNGEFPVAVGKERLSRLAEAPAASRTAHRAPLLDIDQEFILAQGLQVLPHRDGRHPELLSQLGGGLRPPGFDQLQQLSACGRHQFPSF